jgi:glycosyltransferase involved in cell wall biosynthesis
VNVRAARTGVGGVQRYIRELSARLSAHVQPVAPGVSIRGPLGHLWEQLVLPVRVGRRALWSPANVGPLAVARQVLTIHDAAVFDHPEGFTRSYARWYRALLPRLVRRVARIIAVSEFTRGRVIETMGASPERVVVVHNGAAADETPRDPAVANAAYARHRIASNRYVLAVGTLEPRKNLATLLHAWARVAARAPRDIHLVVVGGAGSRHVFAARGDLPIVPRLVLTGALAAGELEALYRGALAFVNVSFYEGFGLPVLEAGARGVPVIASGIPAFREVLGDSALFAEPSEPDSIGAAILELLLDEARRNELRQLGIRNAARFSWDTAAKQTLAVLREV